MFMRVCTTDRHVRQRQIVTFVFLLFASSITTGAALAAPTHAGAVLKPCVILLHGLLRSTSSMEKMEKALLDSGYLVRNTAYPSTEKPVDQLASEAIPAAVESCSENGDRPIHFVTHSMGGILIRYFLEYGRFEIDETGAD